MEKKYSIGEEIRFRVNAENLPIRSEQLRMRLGSYPNLLATQFVVAALVLWMMRGKVADSVLLPWALIFYSLAAVAAFVYRKYGDACHTIEECRAWNRRFIVLTALLGLTWGAAGVLFFVPHDQQYQALLICVILGLAAGAVTINPVHPPSLLIWLFSLMPPLILRVYLEQESTISPAISGMMLLYFGVMLNGGYGLSRGILVSLLRGHENANLVNALSMSEARLHAVLDNSPIGIWLVDTNGKYDFVNKTFCDSVGVPEEAFLSTADLAELLGTETAASCLQSDRACLAADGPHQSFEMLTFADGRKHLMDIKKVPLREASGRASGVIGIAIDITEQKEREEALLRANSKAEMASQAKSDFLANMSHEIRTPMNAIIGMTYLALQTELSPKQRNYLEKTDAAAKGLLNIINDILDFSKIEAGKMHFEQIGFNLEEVVAHLQDLTSFKAQEKGLQFEVEISPDTPKELEGDPLRLGQVLLNLVNNAIKFTERGGVRVKLALAGIESDGARIAFEIADTGIGMSEEERLRLFSAFTQADSSTTRKYGGTGLGLTISKDFVEMMGGRIEVESKAGLGSTFRFTALFGMKKNAPKVCCGEEDRIRLLMLEEKPIGREVFGKLFSSLGFDAKFAVSGGELFLELLHQLRGGNPYHAVLLNSNCEEGEILATIKRIRLEPELEGTVVCMLLSGDSSELPEGQAADLFFDHPLDPQTFCDRLKTQLCRPGDNPSCRPEVSAQERGLKGTKLLLVEDNFANQELAREILESAGFLVDTANNGREAVDKVFTARYDGVLMDCQMPVMDGYEATRRIREAGLSLPIVAMTANAMAGDTEKCIAAGMDDHISKPIDVSRLFSTLARWISPRAPEAAREPFAVRGLDSATALARIGGNAALYRKLLARFRQDEANTVEKIKTAIDAGNVEEAVRLAHTLKGLAGSIGAEKLQALAQETETALAKNEAAKFDLLADELALVLAAIAEIPPPEEKSEQEAGIQPLFAKLEALLQDDDTSAELCFLDLAAKLPPQPLLDEMKRQLASFDYAGALANLHILAQEERT